MTWGDIMKLVSNFNDRFKEAFKDRSVTEFANEIGVSKQSVSAYLNGSRKPKKIVAEAIARQLNVSPAWLLGYDVSMERDYMLGRTENQQAHSCSASETERELISLITKLSPEQQELILAQIRGILANRKK